MTSLVSVIIPNFNYAQYLGEAIESALGQTYSNLEAIVVDDGSTDNSQEILERYADRVTIIQQSNSGVCVARNRGVAESKGEFIAFLDADDVWLPSKIEKQVRAFEESPNAGIVHVGVIDIDDSGNQIQTKLNGMSGKVSHEFLLWEKPVILGGGSGTMISRRVFENIGGFDSQLSTSADWDLYYRICRKFEAAFVPEPLLYYRLHGSNMHGNISGMENEMAIFLEKAFDTDDPQVLALKNRAMSNYHRTLSGSYLHTGSYGRAITHAVKSVMYRPASIGYFAKTPLRLLSRS